MFTICEGYLSTYHIISISLLTYLTYLYVTDCLRDGLCNAFPPSSFPLAVFPTFNTGITTSLCIDALREDAIT